jgi:hypothetical protein
MVVKRGKQTPLPDFYPPLLAALEELKGVVIVWIKERALFPLRWVVVIGSPWMGSTLVLL